MNKRRLLQSLLAASALALGGTSRTGATSLIPLKFQYDWKFEGPSALYLHPAAKGFFKEAGLDVSIDSGSGAAATVGRVASGAYDLGVADVSALMEFIGNNPGAPRPVVVMMIQNNSQAAILALKKSAIFKPSDLSGRRLGAPLFDSARRTFPIFARANGIQNVQWVAMDMALRETLLVRGEVDAVAAFGVTSLLNIEARGIRLSDVTVLPYRDWGAKLYGNAVIASPSLIRNHPQALHAFLAALVRGIVEVVADPAKAIASVRVRDGLLDPALETRRLKMLLDSVVLSADARSEGFGRVSEPRLALMASEISDVFKTKTRIDAHEIWNDRFLPSAGDLDRVFRAAHRT